LLINLPSNSTDGTILIGFPETAILSLQPLVTPELEHDLMERSVGILTYENFDLHQKRPIASVPIIHCVESVQLKAAVACTGAPAVRSASNFPNPEISKKYLQGTTDQAVVLQRNERVLHPKAGQLCTIKQRGRII
jgi:hypothetical protein